MGIDRSANIGLINLVTEILENKSFHQDRSGRKDQNHFSIEFNWVRGSFVELKASISILENTYTYYSIAVVAYKFANKKACIHIKTDSSHSWYEKCKTILEDHINLIEAK